MMQAMKAALCLPLSFALVLSVGVAHSQQTPEATVVVLFPTKLVIVHSPVYIDGTDVAHLKPNHYVKLTVSPGLHSFAGKRKEEGDQFTAEAGKTYYFRIRTSREGFVLEPVSDGVAQYDLKYLTSQPAKE